MLAHGQARNINEAWDAGYSSDCSGTCHGGDRSPRLRDLTLRRRQAGLMPVSISEWTVRPVSVVGSADYLRTDERLAKPVPLSKVKPHACPVATIGIRGNRQSCGAWITACPTRVPTPPNTARSRNGHCARRCSSSAANNMHRTARPDDRPALPALTLRRHCREIRTVFGAVCANEYCLSSSAPFARCCLDVPSSVALLHNELTKSPVLDPRAS